jgi:group I intron endonuclease
VYKNRNDLVIIRAFKKYGYENFSFEILEYCNISILLSREQFYLDLLKPEYNVTKIASSILGIKRTDEFKRKISIALKGNKNCLGRILSKETIEKMSNSKKGLKHKNSTKLLISMKLGTKIYCYKKDLSKNLIFFKSFISIREAARYFNISTNGILNPIKTGKLYKNLYKFSYSLLD